MPMDGRVSLLDPARLVLTGSRTRMARRTVRPSLSARIPIAMAQVDTQMALTWEKKMSMKTIPQLSMRHHQAVAPP